MSCAEYKLLALDLDGTLLDTHGHIAESSREAIRAAQQAGVEVVLATGRDYNGILWEELGDVSVDYVVTNNGSAVYQVKGRKSHIDYENNSVSENIENAKWYLDNTNTYLRAPSGFNDGESFSSLMREIKSIRIDLRNALSWIESSKNEYANFDKSLKYTVYRIPKNNLRKKVSRIK